MWSWENFAKPNWSCGASATLRLAAIDEATLARMGAPELQPRPGTASHGSPSRGFGSRITARWIPSTFIFLSQSPEFTLTTADPLYDRIRASFIDEQ
jgi:hypothetical protein